MKIFRQFQTWLGHDALAAFGPLPFFLVPLGWLGRFLSVAIASTAILAIMVAREVRDWKTHKGRLDKPMDASGVTPRIDAWGDLQGPLTATVCYWGMVLMVWLVQTFFAAGSA